MNTAQIETQIRTAKVEAHQFNREMMAVGREMKPDAIERTNEMRKEYFLMLDDIAALKATLKEAAEKQEAMAREIMHESQLVTDPDYADFIAQLDSGIPMF